MSPELRKHLEDQFLIYKALPQIPNGLVGFYEIYKVCRTCQVRPYYEFITPKKNEEMVICGTCGKVCDLELYYFPWVGEEKIIWYMWNDMTKAYTLCFSFSEAYSFRK